MVYGLGSDRLPRLSGRRSRSIGGGRGRHPRWQWLLAGSADGDVSASGDAGFYGSARVPTLTGPSWAWPPPPTDGGYWLVASTGQVFSFGDAGFSARPAARAFSKPIVGIIADPGRHGATGWWPATAASSPSGMPPSTAPKGPPPGRPDRGHGHYTRRRGYWLVSSTGRVFAFGDAASAGPAGRLAVRRPCGGHGRHPRRRGLLVGASNGGSPPSATPSTARRRPGFAAPGPADRLRSADARFG